MQEPLQTPHTSVPTPDPTVLTTALVLHEIGVIKELVFTRLDAMDEAIKVAKADLVRVPTDVDKQVGNLKELTRETFKTVAERLDGVQTQFLERDTRVKESATATATAVAAALQAAKEAVGEQNKSFTVSIDKSEKATGEQIVQQRLLLEQTTKALNEKIDGLKERMDRNEGLGVGQRAATTDQRATAGEIRAYILAAVTIALAILAFVSFALR